MNKTNTSMLTIENYEVENISFVFINEESRKEYYDKLAKKLNEEERQEKRNNFSKSEGMTAFRLGLPGWMSKLKKSYKDIYEE